MACAAEGQLGSGAVHQLCTTQAWLESADRVKLDEMMLHGAEEGSKAEAVMLDPTDLGPPDLMLVGNGWSIPVHRCKHIPFYVCKLTKKYMYIPTRLLGQFPQACVQS